MGTLNDVKGIGGLALVGAVGFLVWKNWDTIKGFFNTLGDTFSLAPVTKPDGSTGYNDPIRDTAYDLGKALGDLLNGNQKTPAQVLQENNDANYQRNIYLMTLERDRLIKSGVCNASAYAWWTKRTTTSDYYKGVTALPDELATMTRICSANDPDPKLSPGYSQVVADAMFPPSKTAGTNSDPVAAVTGGFYKANPVGAWCEKTQAYVDDPASCADYQGTAPRDVTLAPGVVENTPNVVLGAYKGSCGLKYSQDGVYSLPMPPTCKDRKVCPDGTTPTTMGAGGFGGKCNTYDDLGRQVCSDCRSGRCVPLPPNPGCDYFAYYKSQRNCAVLDAVNTASPTCQTGSG